MDGEAEHELNGRELKAQGKDENLHVQHVAEAFISSTSRSTVMYFSKRARQQQAMKASFYWIDNSFP